MKKSIDMVKISDFILINDHQLVAVNKPATMPSVPDKTGDPSVLELTERYCRKKLYPTHRLDRPVSGLMVMAKSASVVSHLQRHGQSTDVRKTYLAIVEGKNVPDSGTLDSYLLRSARTAKAHVVSSESSGGKRAITHYRVVQRLDRYCLLEIATESGRFHQIRCQLAHAGWPIKGDVKYGARRKNQDRSVCLHAWQYHLKHPTKGEKITLKATVPDSGIWQAAMRAWQADLNLNAHE